MSTSFLVLGCLLIGVALGVRVGFFMAENEHKPSSNGASGRHLSFSGKVIASTPADKPLRPFRLRRSWKETRAQFEAEHNTKAQRNASLQEQIRKAQEGTLR